MRITVIPKDSPIFPGEYITLILLFAWVGRLSMGSFDIKSPKNLKTGYFCDFYWSHVVLLTFRVKNDSYG